VSGEVRFTGVLVEAEGRKATGIEVPPAVLDELGAGRRPAVVVHLGDHQMQTTIGSMGGRSMIPVSAAVRDEAGLAAGDEVAVRLTVATAPREVVVPDDLAAALAAEPEAEAFFAGLSNSLQRYHVDQVTGAKTPETRARRIEKAVSLFLAGRAR
jgi:hypothetical protein